MKFIFITIAFLFSAMGFSQLPSKPYPNHSDYTTEHIKPTNYSQIQLDDQTSSFYNQWKVRYLKNDCGNANEYYIFSGGDAKNVSEAQGYGMMITAYMAGYDQNAKNYFDGLYQFYRSHPSNINDSLMDWQQKTCDDAPSNDDDSASDGDIDIAFALLLAHAQWGSKGEIAYLNEAKKMINAIMKDDVNQNTLTIKLGDWSKSNNPKYFYSTRTSDFITDHFRVFSYATNDSKWNTIVNNCYDLVEGIQNNYSNNTGLLPDFIIDINTSPKPANADFLESEYDGNYYYNACRTPLRLGIDYLINGDINAKSAIKKINSWLLESVNENVNKISNGYKLNGEKIYDWNDATFIGPFAVGAMSDINNQNWLNKLYEELVSENNINSGDYYSNTIKLLSMIVLSGNYWVPNQNVLSSSEIENKNFGFVVYPNSSNGMIHFKFENGFINFKKISTTITDVNGKTILKSGKLKYPFFIDISSIRNGVYFLSVSMDNKPVATKKIIKK